MTTPTIDAMMAHIEALRHRVQGMPEAEPSITIEAGNVELTRLVADLMRRVDALERERDARSEPRPYGKPLPDFVPQRWNAQATTGGPRHKHDDTL